MSYLSIKDEYFHNFMQSVMKYRMQLKNKYNNYICMYQLGFSISALNVLSINDYLTNGNVVFPSGCYQICILNAYYFVPCNPCRTISG